ncbi:senescence marker protein-30 (SMP-30), partial [Pseudomonas syringae pv. pisi str. 1704B]
DTSAGGAADGCTVDAEGCLWQALVYAGKLVLDNIPFNLR